MTYGRQRAVFRCETPHVRTIKVEANLDQIDPNELIDEKDEVSISLVKPSELDKTKAKDEVNGIKDNILNEALWLLGANIISKSSK